MNALVLIVGLLCYVITAVVVRRHFASPTLPRKVRLTTILGDIGLIAFGYLMWRDEHATAGLAAALGPFLVSQSLFFWSVTTTRARPPRIAFDPEPPGFVTQAGPYRYIRHPFYASYILFWLGCAVATLHPVSLAILVLVSAILVAVALREERSFEDTAFAADYSNYRRTTGLLWPKPGVGGNG